MEEISPFRIYQPFDRIRIRISKPPVPNAGRIRQNIFNRKKN